MRQHPIPQNVLDIEFKLFTRFTLKEFAYLAAGISIGGIFLYFSIGGDIPGIIGIPLFAIFAGIGAFLALVPINDQPADTFIKNYFTAINNPTQRVWLNDEMKEQRITPQIQATPQVKDGSNAKVIGGSNIPGANKIQVFQEKEGDDILETEKEKTQQEEPPVQREQVITETTDVKQEQVQEDNILTISEENLSQYQFPIKTVDKLPGNINLWICSKDNQPLINIDTYRKDSNGKVLYANKVGSNGYFLSNQQ